MHDLVSSWKDGEGGFARVPVRLDVLLKIHEVAFEQWMLTRDCALGAQ